MTWWRSGVYLVGVATAFAVRTWLPYRATGDRHTRPTFGTAAAAKSIGNPDQPKA